jgi:hypothetical protein
MAFLVYTTVICTRESTDVNWWHEHESIPSSKTQLVGTNLIDQTFKEWRKENYEDTGKTAAVVIVEAEDGLSCTITRGFENWETISEYKAAVLSLNILHVRTKYESDNGIIRRLIGNLSKADGRVNRRWTYADLRDEGDDFYILLEDGGNILLLDFVNEE